MFSCKIILAPYAKRDGSRSVCLQAIIDRKAARIPLGFYLEEKYFDGKNEVRSSHPNHDNLNIEIATAIAHATNVASLFRQQRKALTPLLFKNEFMHPAGEIDLIKFIRAELDLRSPDLALNTIKQHNTVINKLSEFRKVIRFGDLSPDLMQHFKNELRKKNQGSTVNKLLKIVKQYLSDARKKGHAFEDPFKLIKIKTFRSTRTALSEKELQRLEDYFQKKDCPAGHKKVLRYFLFSCYTGLRISDIGLVTWDNISDDLLTYVPQKTKDKLVTVPLTREKNICRPSERGSCPSSIPTPTR